MAEYLKTNEDVVSYFKKVAKNFAHPFDVDYVYITNNKLKKLVKISKLPDQYAFILGANLLVTFNEVFYDNFDDDTKDLLISQEIDKIEFNTEKGTISLTTNPLISTSSGIIDKFSIENVKNANQLERQFFSQLKDKEKESSGENNDSGKKRGRKNY
jgi:hypothetical protein